MEQNQKTINQHPSSFTQPPAQFEQTPQKPPTPPTTERKTKWWVFVVGFLVIIAFGIIMNAVWYDYLSPAARDAARMKKQYAQYEEWQKSYDEAMAADTYGGKTPEETLALFIDALEKEDIDLASKYFMIDESLGRQKWVDFLTKIKSEGNMKRFAEDLKQAKRGNSIENNDVGFVLLNEDNSVGFQFNLKFNEQTKVWKIESL